MRVLTMAERERIEEAARLEVENAEDDLVQKTEVAITLMKTVLENVRARTFSPLFYAY